MDNQAVIEQIVQNLAFEVETVPKNEQVKVTNSTNSKQLNVKIKVRKKDNSNGRHGVISIPKPDGVESHPQKIRLVNSDQTIISFDVYMEADFETKPMRKPRKHMFDRFKSANCLGAPDDDEDQYVPSTSYSANITDGSRSDGVLKHNFTLSKNTFDEYDLAKQKNGILGKCKPGGCLDPPFNEDKYPYEPGLKDQIQDNYNLKRQNLHDAESKKSKKSKRKTSGKLSFSQDPTGKVDTSNSILNLYQVESLVNSLSTTQSNSIITYPPASTLSELPVSANKTVQNRLSYEDKARKSLNEFKDAYFSTRKGIIKDSEKDTELNSDDENGISEQKSSNRQSDKSRYFRSIGKTISGSTMSKKVNHENSIDSKITYLTSEKNKNEIENYVDSEKYDKMNTQAKLYDNIGLKEVLNVVGEVNIMDADKHVETYIDQDVLELHSSVRSNIKGKSYELNRVPFQKTVPLSLGSRKEGSEKTYIDETYSLKMDNIILKSQNLNIQDHSSIENDQPAVRLSKIEPHESGSLYKSESDISKNNLFTEQKSIVTRTNAENAVHLAVSDALNTSDLSIAKIDSKHSRKSGKFESRLSENFNKSISHASLCLEGKAPASNKVDTPSVINQKDLKVKREMVENNKYTTNDKSSKLFISPKVVKESRFKEKNSEILPEPKHNSNQFQTSQSASDLNDIGNLSTETDTFTTFSLMTSKKEAKQDKTEEIQNKFSILEKSPSYKSNIGFQSDKYNNEFVENEKIQMSYFNTNNSECPDDTCSLMPSIAVTHQDQKEKIRESNKKIEEHLCELIDPIDKKETNIKPEIIVNHLKMQPHNEQRTNDEISRYPEVQEQVRLNSNQAVDEFHSSNGNNKKIPHTITEKNISNEEKKYQVVVKKTLNSDANSFIYNNSLNIKDSVDKQLLKSDDLFTIETYDLKASSRSSVEKTDVSGLANAGEIATQNESHINIIKEIHPASSLSKEINNNLPQLAITTNFQHSNDPNDYKTLLNNNNQSDYNQRPSKLTDTTDNIMENSDLESESTQPIVTSTTSTIDLKSVIRELYPATLQPNLNSVNYPSSDDNYSNTTSNIREICDNVRFQHTEDIRTEDSQANATSQLTSKYKNFDEIILKSEIKKLADENYEDIRKKPDNIKTFHGPSMEDKRESIFSSHLPEVEIILKPEIKERADENYDESRKTLDNVKTYHEPSMKDKSESIFSIPLREVEKILKPEIKEPADEIRKNLEDIKTYHSVEDKSASLFSSHHSEVERIAMISSDIRDDSKELKMFGSQTHLMTVGIFNTNINDEDDMKAVLRSGLEDFGSVTKATVEDFVSPKKIIVEKVIGISDTFLSSIQRTDSELSPKEIKVENMAIQQINNFENIYEMMIDTGSKVSLERNDDNYLEKMDIIRRQIGNIQKHKESDIDEGLVSSRNSKARISESKEKVSRDDSKQIKIFDIKKDLMAKNVLKKRTGDKADIKVSLRSDVLDYDSGTKEFVQDSTTPMKRMSQGKKNISIDSNLDSTQQTNFELSLKENKATNGNNANFFVTSSISSIVSSSSTLKRSRKGTVSVSIAIQSYLNDKNERVLRTFDAATEPKRYPDDTITVVKSQVRLSSNEIRVPIDDKNDMFIYIKNASKKHTLMSQADIGTVSNSSKLKLKDKVTKFKGGEIEASNSKFYRSKVESDVLHNTLMEIYDQELVPLQNIIKALKEDIDLMAAQQTAFKEKIFCSRKNKPNRVLHSNKRCGCMKKTN